MRFFAYVWLFSFPWLWFDSLVFESIFFFPFILVCIEMALFALGQEVEDFEICARTNGKHFWWGVMSLVLILFLKDYAFLSFSFFILFAFANNKIIKHRTIADSIE
tara:strand:- start:92 stop:409 length:318 start_codon:yes stop_codon:yes gene_type:complete